MISRLLILAFDLPAWDPYVQKIKFLEQRPEFLCICKAGGIGLSIRLNIVILKNWQWPSKIFAHLKSCHRLVLLLKLDDIHMFNSTELVRLTWIRHPGMSIQKRRFSKHTSAPGVIKAVITELVVSAQCDEVCMILHQTLVPISPKPLDVLHLLFPKCLNSETGNTSFSIYWGKKGDLIKGC